jgi:8-oxo-dGTP pyrophosphatase MutT (NUDIX family)
MLQQIYDDYVQAFPQDAAGLALLRAQIAEGEVLQSRKNFRGHVCGSSIVLSPDRKSLLLIHHNIFNRWQQPGGHMDVDEANPAATARRECEEETGVHIAEQVAFLGNPSLPIQIDSHHIAANPKKHEPEHYHHDFRYVFVAASTALEHRPEEVAAAEWVPLDDPRVDILRVLVDRLHAHGVA